MIAAICAAAAAAAVIAEATPTVTAAVVRVFALRYRAPEDALAVVRPLLTDSGSVLVQPKGNTLTVRDSAAAVERAAHSIAAWDRPPRPIDLRVTLLRASTSGRAPPSSALETSAELRSVAERLKRLFRFTDLARLDAAVVQGVEGQTVAYVLGGEYRLEFRIEPADDARQVRLKGLLFEHLRRGPGPGVVEVRNDILRTTISVTIGQPYILAVGRDESAAGALVLVFNGTWRTPVPGPGIGGID